jgi:hypothetical protein
VKRPAFSDAAAEAELGTAAAAPAPAVADGADDTGGAVAGAEGLHGGNVLGRPPPDRPRPHVPSVHCLLWQQQRYCYRGLHVGMNDDGDVAVEGGQQRTSCSRRCHYSSPNRTAR